DASAEGRDWLARVLAMPGSLAPSIARAEVLDGAAELAGETGDRVTARRLAEEGLATCQALGDRRGIAEALRLLALSEFNEGDNARAEELGVEALTQARE